MIQVSQFFRAYLGEMMTSTTQSGNGGDDGSTIGTILKIIGLIVVAIIFLRFFFWLLGFIIPIAIVLGLGYLVYRLIVGSGDDTDKVSHDEPYLLDFEKEEDPLEKRFRELEQEEARVDAELSKLDRER